MNRLPKRLSLPRILLILYCIFTSSAVGAQKEGSRNLFSDALNRVMVQGTVEDKKGTPVPGLKVSAVYLWFDPNAKKFREAGERSNTVTDNLGRYLLFYTHGMKPLDLLKLFLEHGLEHGDDPFSGLEAGHDFIEVYWDTTLIYRSTPLTIVRPLVHNIKLK